MKTHIFAVLLTFLALANCQAQNFFNANQTRAGKLSKVINKLNGYWLLSDPLGNRYDSTHYGSTMTDHNSVGRVSSGGFTACSFTRASSQYLSATSNSSLQTGGSSFEVTFWFNNTLIAGAADDPIVNKGNNAGTTAEFYVYVENTSAKPTIQIKDDTGANKMASWGSAISASTWYFCDAYFDSVNNQVGISINGGAFVTAGTTSGHPTANTAQALAIGANSDGGTFWNGYIAWVSFSKQLLTTAQRTAIYNAGNGSPWARF